MSKKKTVHKITVMINRAITRQLLAGLRDIGIHDIYVAAAKAPIIRERKTLLALRTKDNLIDTPLDIITFLVPPAVSDAVLNLVIDQAELTIQGRGSVHSEEVTVAAAHPVFDEPAPDLGELPSSRRMLQELQVVCCIVQRGQGIAIAKVALYTGAGVPAIYYGSGTGVRDKMNLLRITIPAEKEIVVVGTTPYNCESIMDMMIDLGQLERPGKGFIYTYMVNKGLADLQVSRGDRRHAATMEQVVTAIDQLRGDTRWRRWAVTESSAKHRRRQFLTGLVDLTLFCNAGKGSELVKAAMAAGAPGATINTYRHFCPENSPVARIGLSREACSMVVPVERVDGVIEAVGAAGAFSDQCYGQVQLRDIKKAFTYVSDAR